MSASDVLGVSDPLPEVTSWYKSSFQMGSFLFDNTRVLLMLPFISGLLSAMVTNRFSGSMQAIVSPSMSVWLATLTFGLGL